MYDPVIGRFLSADPFVSDATNTQALNRYSYVENNPLSYTDPSGFFLSKLKKKLKKLKGKIRRHIKRSLQNTFGALGRELRRAFTKHQWLSTVVALGSCLIPGAQVICGQIQIAFQGLYSWGMTGDFGAGLKAVAMGAISAAMFAPLHGIKGAMGVLGHGLAGGVSSVMRGGSFKHGFIAGAFTKAFQGQIGKINIGGEGSIESIVARTAAASVVGGSAAKLTGGNFENGAITGAFSHLFNSEKENLKKLSLTQMERIGDGLMKQSQKWQKVIGRLDKDGLESYMGRSMADETFDLRKFQMLSDLKKIEALGFSLSSAKGPLVIIDIAKFGASNSYPLLQYAEKAFSLYQSGAKITELKPRAFVSCNENARCDYVIH